MANKEPYLITSLPFENTILEDECNANLWKIKDSPVIVNTSNLDNGKFKKALFCKKGYLWTTNKLLENNKDFTVTYWVYVFAENVSSCWNDMFTIYMQNLRCAHFYNRNTDNKNDQCITLRYNITLNNTATSDLVNASYISFDGINLSFNKWFNIAICYEANKKILYLYVNGKIYEKLTNITFTFDYGQKSHIGSCWGDDDRQYNFLFTTGYLKHIKIYNGIAKWTTSSFDLRETYEQPTIQYTTKRNIYHLYNIPYDSLYNYNINDSLLYNDTYRDINKISEYNNDIYRSILRNYIYNNNTYRYIKRIDKYKNITKRNIKHDYMDILYNTKRLIYNNINIINYVHRHKVRNGNNINDIVRSVISWKHKIIAFITNPRYKLR